VANVRVGDWDVCGILVNSTRVQKSHRKWVAWVHQVAVEVATTWLCGVLNFGVLVCRQDVEGLWKLRYALLIGSKRMFGSFV